MGSKSAPAPPDYEAAATATGEASKEALAQQTFANRPNQYTPWGSSTWEPNQVFDPSTGQMVTSWDQNISLSPDEQASLDDQQRIQRARSGLAEGLIGRAGSELDTPVDWSSLPDAGQLDTSGLQGVGLPDRSQLPGMQPSDFSSLDTPQGFDNQNFGAVDAAGAYNPDFASTAFDRSMSLMQPQMDRQREAAEVRLRNQGLTPGTEAYDNALGDLMTGQQETLSRLAQDSVFTGSQEQQRQFEREIGLRGQQAGEEGQRAASDMALRSMFGDEMGQQFNQSAAMRSMMSGEQTQDAAMQAALRGQQFGEQQAGADFQSRARQQAIAEEAQRRGWSLNEMNALLTGQQVSMPGMPGFQAAGASEAADYLRAAGMEGDFANQRYATALGPLNTMLGTFGLSQ